MKTPKSARAGYARDNVAAAEVIAADLTGRYAGALTEWAHLVLTGYRNPSRITQSRGEAGKGLAGFVNGNETD